MVSLFQKNISLKIRVRDNGEYHYFGKTIRLERVPIYVELVSGLGDEMRRMEPIKIGEIPADGKDHIIEGSLDWSSLEPLARAGSISACLAVDKVSVFPKEFIECHTNGLPVYLKK